jgi:hypothetical protein
VGSAELIGHNIPITEEVLGQENGGGDVTVTGLAKQVPAGGHPALGSRLFHHVAASLDLAPALDGLGADAEKAAISSSVHCMAHSFAVQRGRSLP